NPGPADRWRSRIGIRDQRWESSMWWSRMGIRDQRDQRIVLNDDRNRRWLDPGWESGTSGV
ncbi:MAG: hypothetical protein ACUVXJ_12200, partial [Phycisphaerae bacterium]